MTPRPSARVGHRAPNSDLARVLQLERERHAVEVDGLKAYIRELEGAFTDLRLPMAHALAVLIDGGARAALHGEKDAARSDAEPELNTRGGRT